MWWVSFGDGVFAESLWFSQSLMSFDSRPLQWSAVVLPPPSYLPWRASACRYTLSVLTLTSCPPRPRAPEPPRVSRLRPPLVPSSLRPLGFFSSSLVSPGVKPVPPLRRRPVWTSFQGSAVCLSWNVETGVMWNCDVMLDEEDLQSAFWIGNTWPSTVFVCARRFSLHSFIVHRPVLRDIKGFLIFKQLHLPSS